MVTRRSLASVTMRDDGGEASKNSRTSLREKANEILSISVMSLCEVESSRAKNVTQVDME